MDRLILRMVFSAICVTISGCYAQGISYSLNASETAYFLTLKRCEDQAILTNSDGSAKYVGYKCFGKLLFYTTESRDYYNGKPVAR